ncbi:bone morphogenetic protein receptor type-2-like isoform X1 [Cololabis saira]|uniref:bone morphogenetic protein receptor type-2-like isoform X1 n=2 Tax=Cololabis saira TaxID=129043 RepID=UPI002AD43C10|nr:bone morphogenetic protein receptor type-2-like isoform X1 [Cololabis saira]
MASSALTVCVCVLLLPAISGFQPEDGEERLCAFTNSLQGAEPASANELRGVVLENGTIRCSRGSRCYGLWEKRADGEMQLLNQGCWTYVGNQQECHGDRCILVTATPSQIQKSNYRFCCCSHDLCNVNYTEALPTPDTPALRPMKRDDRNNSQADHKLKQKETALIALVTVAIAAIVIMALFLGYRMLKRKQKQSLSAVDVMEAANMESAVELDNLKLLELIGRGRYGAVFRGSLNERCVAVKVFSSANRQNFINERAIYHLPILQQHDNIARFLTADEKTAADGRPEFLILMEFYPHGCLSRYLSLHTADWLTCCRMTHGVTRGLAFLHTELHRGDQYKPAVAHRDLTSRNVLVRADLSCVLADFGLSMRLTGNRPCRQGDDDTVAISEVGTVRYMSPEVLGGALNLRDCESALKQVDVYALGLLYWETFRRCSDLFSGEAVPEYQLAFQAELGNHPSFEDMQMLVVREKYRPRFPEAWKENSLVLRSLKETMEDCWDQDAEARLTAQCAEERLAELTLLSTQTALHNHRNLSHSRWSSLVGPTSSYIEDLQGGVVKNLQGDGHPASLVKTSGPEGAEKNRNSINYERQQAQARSSAADCSTLTSTTPTPATILSTISENQPPGGAVPSVPICLQLTEKDLEATKLDPKEVSKNLRETSDENLMEHSQKQFGSEPQTTNLLYHQLLHSTEANRAALAPQGEDGGVDSLPPPSLQPLPKQQNLPQRPTSLLLLPKSKEAGSVSSRLKTGKLKSNHQQVETGVAKMNTVAVAAAAEPHLVTTVTNNVNTKSSTANGNEGQPLPSGCRAGVPTLVTNSMIGGGRTNPAGPQLEEEEKVEAGMSRGADSHLNLLNFSPDEHEPLLSREQLPAESEPIPRLHNRHQDGNVSSARGPNSNNNNNRLALGSEAKVHNSERNTCSEIGQRGGVVRPRPEPQPHTSDTGPCQKAEETASAEVEDLEKVFPEVSESQASQEQELEAKASSSEALISDALTLDQTEGLPASHSRVSPLQVSASESLESAVAVSYVSEPADLQSLEPLAPGLLQSQMRQTKARRPERPCSLDLSSSCISSDDVSMADNGSLSATGEKIKRRVKTPYTLKKWRPASWVVSTDTALDPDFDFNISTGDSSQIHFSSGLHRAGSIGFPKINQSKSSMAVFLVGGGATTKTSEPDGMTRF